jgi:hypothetical protein
VEMSIPGPQMRGTWGTRRYPSQVPRCQGPGAPGTRHPAGSANDFVLVYCDGLALAEEQAEQQPAEAEVEGGVGADGEPEGAGGGSDDETRHEEPEKTAFHEGIELVVGDEGERAFQKKSEEGHE